MRRLAASLGSGATSLYWHVASKEDLFELVFDEVLGELELPEPPAADWREGLSAIARQVHAIMHRHPWLVLLGVQPGLGPNGLRYFRYTAGLFRDPTANEHAKPRKTVHSAAGVTTDPAPSEAIVPGPGRNPIERLRLTVGLF